MEPSSAEAKVLGGSSQSPHSTACACRSNARGGPRRSSAEARASIRGPPPSRWMAAPVNIRTNHWRRAKREESACRSLASSRRIRKPRTVFRRKAATPTARCVPRARHWSRLMAIRPAFQTESCSETRVRPSLRSPPSDRPVLLRIFFISRGTTATPPSCGHHGKRASSARQRHQPSGRRRRARDAAHRGWQQFWQIDPEALGKDIVASDRGSLKRPLSTGCTSTVAPVVAEPEQPTARSNFARECAFTKMCTWICAG